MEFSFYNSLYNCVFSILGTDSIEYLFKNWIVSGNGGAYCSEIVSFWDSSYNCIAFSMS